jgi:hypothetical protein
MLLSAGVSHSCDTHLCAAFGIAEGVAIKQRGVRTVMFTAKYVSISYLVFPFLLAFTSPAFGHGEGGASAKNLVEIAFTPNPNIPEFANAKGTAQVLIGLGFFIVLVFYVF